MKKRIFIALLSLACVFCLTFGMAACGESNDILKYSLLSDGTYEVSYLNDKNTTKIVIPSTHDKKAVTSIGMFAFFGCTSLTSVTIPNSVTSIGAGAFLYCRSLESIIIPNSVTSIGGVAFGGCISLKNITIPDSVTSIGDWAFQRCTSLESITIPNSVTSIDSGTFGDCTNLTSITIPNSVTSIGDRALSYCTSLTSINFDGTIEQWDSIIKDSDWDEDTENYTIYCKDGEITKAGEVTKY